MYASHVLQAITAALLQRNVLLASLVLLAPLLPLLAETVPMVASALLLVLPIALIVQPALTTVCWELLSVRFVLLAQLPTLHVVPLVPLAHWVSTLPPTVLQNVNLVNLVSSPTTTSLLLAVVVHKELSLIQQAPIFALPVTMPHTATKLQQHLLLFVKAVLLDFQVLVHPTFLVLASTVLHLLLLVSGLNFNIGAGTTDSTKAGCGDTTVKAELQIKLRLLTTDASEVVTTDIVLIPMH